MSFGSGARAAIGALALLVAAALVQAAAASPSRTHDTHHRFRHDHRQAALDLKLAGTPASVITGQQVTYTATIGNHGSGSARNAAFLDMLPPHTTLISASASQGSCGGSGGSHPVILCNLGRLSPHAAATVNIVVTTTQQGTIVDRGWVSSQRPGHWHDQRDVVTRVQNGGPNLDLQLTGSPSSVSTGQQVAYTATVTNRGTAPAATAAFQDILPGGVNLVSASASQGSCSGSPTVLCSLGSLAPNASATVTITVATTHSGTILDRGWVSVSPPGNWQHGRLVVTQVRDANPDLDLKLSAAPPSVNAGQQVTYTAIVTNHGSGAAATAAFQDLISDKTTFVSASTSQGTCAGNPTVVCNLGSLAPNASATVTIVVTTTQPGPVVDRGWVSINPPGDWHHERDVTVNVTAPPAADLDLQLAGAPPVVNAGQQVVYTATIANHGPAAVPTAAFQDELPAKVNLVSATASQGSCSGNPTVVCNVGQLAANASATVTITIATTQGGTIVDRGSVSVTPGAWHHERVVVTQVRNVSPDLDFHLVGSPSGVTAGQQITYTAVVGNHGSGPANAALQDVLPANVTLVSATSTQGACGGSPTIVCSIGTLAPGATATVTITVTTTQPGSLVDRAWVSANPPGNWEHERDVVTDVHKA
jgi:uncharacterized repeat protein (TIGR01451 family)